MIEIENSDTNDCDTNKQLSEIITDYKKSFFCNFCKLKFLCVILTIVLLIILIILFGYAYEKPSESNSFANLSTKSSEWTHNMNSYESDSNVKLIDIDEDGLDDIIFGVTGILKVLKNKIYFTY